MHFLKTCESSLSISEYEEFTKRIRSKPDMSVGVEDGRVKVTRAELEFSQLSQMTLLNYVCMIFCTSLRLIKAKIKLISSDVHRLKFIEAYHLKLE